jgi:hypothetical protein
MDSAKVDKIIQYALAVAAGDDDYRCRELGPIHLLKYVYLADLAWAERHNGETYTGTVWQFYHFGPWSVEVLNRIEPACKTMGAEKRTFEYGEKGKEGIRWKSRTGEQDRFESDLSITVLSAVKGAVRKFGPDTSSLLHYVYLTKPMLNAAPEELLNFSTAVVPPPPPKESPKEPMSVKAQKRRERQLKDTRSLIQEKLALKKSNQAQKHFFRQPRYDETYVQGTEWLDSLAGNQIPCMKGAVTFSADIWKSKSRFDPEIH